MPELIADIAVNAPLKQLFSYRVPASLQALAQVGMRVRVPFGRRTTVGVLLALRQGPSDGLKELKELLDAEPLLTPELIKLLRWAAEYYCHPVGQVIRSSLPAGLGSDKATTKILSESVYSVVSTAERPRGGKQRQLYDFIREQQSSALSRLREVFDAPHAPLKRLVALGFLHEQQQEKQRDPFFAEPLPTDTDLTLTDEQQVALNAVTTALTAATFQAFLLHGVTGSGKTEVYLRAVENCLQSEKQALVLVPEIALTPQLVARFRARFEGRGVKLAVLHSGLSDGERYDAWRAIIRNQVQIVIGARSAIFAPLQNPGLIIVDEEHEASYKQGEGFRYNARDLALMRGQQQGCPVLLGSATPSLGSYYRSQQGIISYLTLEKRSHAGAMPAVELLDLTQQRPAGILSNALIEAVQQALELRQQSLLLLNRRGFAPFLLCTDCGSSFHCPNCEITLTFHQGQRQVRCHYCDYSEPPAEACPKCHGLNIEPQGAGTERLEQELTELFPGARIARMDRDTTSRKGAHQRLVTKMMAGEIDILVGTQMIAKGHDFPGVSLVGVLGADSILNLPDFRAAERSFSLLTQVAGRAGRASGGGKVLIQTFNPAHYALTCAAEQDYRQFYAAEIPFRQELGYPPCGFLVNLILAGNNEAQVKLAAQRLADDLCRVGGEVEILGPSPCPLFRLRGKSRFQILLKSFQRPVLRRMLSQLENLARQISKGVVLTIDVDPLDMF